MFADKGDLLPSRGDKALKERIYFQTPIRTRLINRVNVSWHEMNYAAAGGNVASQGRPLSAHGPRGLNISGIWFRETE